MGQRRAAISLSHTDDDDTERNLLNIARFVAEVITNSRQSRQLSGKADPAIAKA